MAIHIPLATSHPAAATAALCCPWGMGKGVQRGRQAGGRGADLTLLHTKDLGVAEGRKPPA